jgi:hypothetical protein
MFPFQGPIGRRPERPARVHRQGMPQFDHQTAEQPEEIAEVVAFLVSGEAGAISGSPVRADSGVVLGIT